MTGCVWILTPVYGAKRGNVGQALYSDGSYVKVKDRISSAGAAPAKWLSKPEHLQADHEVRWRARPAQGDDRHFILPYSRKFSALFLRSCGT